MDKAPRFDKIITDAMNDVNEKFKFANRSKSTTHASVMALRP